MCYPSVEQITSQQTPSKSHVKVKLTVGKEKVIVAGSAHDTAGKKKKDEKKQVTKILQEVNRELQKANRHRLRNVKQKTSYKEWTKTKVTKSVCVTKSEQKKRYQEWTKKKLPRVKKHKLQNVKQQQITKSKPKKSYQKWTNTGCKKFMPAMGSSFNNERRRLLYTSKHK